MWDKTGEDISYKWLKKLKQTLLVEQEEEVAKEKVTTAKPAARQFTGEREKTKTLAALSDEDLVKYAMARAQKCNSMNFISVGNKNAKNVKLVQQQLQKAGADITDPEGTFGQTTLIATIAAQKQAGIRPDGCVGSETIAALKIPIKGAAAAGGKGAMASEGKCRYKKPGNTRRTRKIMQGDDLWSYTEGAKGRINIAPEWQNANITRVQLHNGKRVKLHKAVADGFAKAFQEASEKSGYNPSSVQTQVTRHILWDPSKPLSNHTYGTAVDFDPADNPYGKRSGELRDFPEFINIMNCYGWLWGGDWKTPDDMHFEFDISRL